MRLKVFSFIWFAALAFAPVALSADNGCCDTPAMACCEKPAAACCEKPAAACCDEKPCEMPCCADGGGCDMPCCSDQGHGRHAVEPSAIDVLIAMDQNAILPTQLQMGETPVRQAAIVWFHRPVWVGDVVLMGKHVIEHDTDRQARGEPCTHIYAVDDLTVPVAAFHCTHLDRKTIEKSTVVLQSLPDGSRKLLEFQFAGEDAAHGFPAR